MSSSLRRHDETITLTCSVFDVVLEEEDRDAFAKDPATVLRRLITDAGEPAPNAILGNVEMNGAGGSEGPKVVHVDSPPDRASRYIIFV